MCQGLCTMIFGIYIEPVKIYQPPELVNLLWNEVIRGNGISLLPW